MSKVIKMGDVMRALEKVAGAPMLSSNQCWELAQALSAESPFEEAPPLANHTEEPLGVVGWKVWGGDKCAHCCNGDRCDDPECFERSKCPYCKGSGEAIWLKKPASPPAPVAVTASTKQQEAAVVIAECLAPGRSKGPVNTVAQAILDLMAAPVAVDPIPPKNPPFSAVLQPGEGIQETPKGWLVLPGPLDEGGGQSDADYNSACGWNACLDKVKEMNAL